MSASAPGARRRRDRRGFALLATMWLTLAIATAALAFALESKASRAAVTNLAESAQARAAARAGLETALSRLDRLNAGRAPAGPEPVDPADPWQWADTLVSGRGELTPGGPKYDVRVRDVGAVLDLNGSSEDVLRALFLALNVSDDQATRLAQAILDWIDLDDVERSSGAERDSYAAAGRVVLPRNHDFTSVEELRDVMGVTPEIYRAIAPYVAIGTTSPVNVNTAPEPVLRTVPGFTDNVVAGILAARASHRRIESPGQLLALIPESSRRRLEGVGGRVTITTRAVEITSTGWAPGGRTRVVMRALVSRGEPTARVQWRREE